MGFPGPVFPGLDLDELQQSGKLEQWEGKLGATLPGLAFGQLAQMPGVAWERVIKPALGFLADPGSIYDASITAKSSVAGQAQPAQAAPSIETSPKESGGKPTSESELDRVMRQFQGLYAGGANRPPTQASPAQPQGMYVRREESQAGPTPEGISVFTNVPGMAEPYTPSRGTLSMQPDRLGGFREALASGDLRGQQEAYAQLSPFEQRLADEHQARFAPQIQLAEAERAQQRAMLSQIYAGEIQRLMQEESRKRQILGGKTEDEWLKAQAQVEKERLASEALYDPRRQAARQAAKLDPNKISIQEQAEILREAAARAEELLRYYTLQTAFPGRTGAYQPAPAPQQTWER